MLEFKSLCITCFAELFYKIENATQTSINIFELIDLCFEENISDLATSFIGNGGLTLSPKISTTFPIDV